MDSAVHTGSQLRVLWGAILLGFAMGGFFDGILLHQILQWHHLLSGLKANAVADLRVQILADGIFHAAMYVVGAVGLWLLWFTRRGIDSKYADRLIIAYALIGFGTWHIIDAVLSHWVIGLHRIRMDAANPLLWDLIWFVVFGVAFVAAGLALRSKGPGDGTPGRARLSISVLVVMMSAAVLAPTQKPTGAVTIVVWAPWASTSHSMATLVDMGGSLVWSDPKDGMWAVELDGIKTTKLYAAGALMVSNTVGLQACLNFVTPTRADTITIDRTGRKNQQSPTLFDRVRTAGANQLPQKKAQRGFLERRFVYDTLS